MKTCYLIIALALISVTARAQQICKIVISYDDNGYRIQRSQSCTTPPDPNEPPATPPPATSSTIRKDGDAGAFEIYPNPSNNVVNIVLDPLSLAAPCSFILTDVSGKQLLQQDIQSPATMLELSSYADGVYFIILKRGQQTNTVRIVKQYGAGR